MSTEARYRCVDVSLFRMGGHMAMAQGQVSGSLQLLDGPLLQLLDEQGVAPRGPARHRKGGVGDSAVAADAAVELRGAAAGALQAHRDGDAAQGRDGVRRRGPVGRDAQRRGRARQQLPRPAQVGAEDALPRDRLRRLRRGPTAAPGDGGGEGQGERERGQAAGGGASSHGKLQRPEVEPGVGKDRGQCAAGRRSGLPR